MMGRRGPAPTPTKLLENRGSWRANERDPEPEPPAGRPTQPSWMPTEAKREWTRITKQLDAMGILHQSDRAVLAAYCVAWADLKAATEALENEGLTVTTDKGNVVQNPLVGVKNRALDQVNRLAQQFGLTPSSRSSVKAPEKKQSNNKGRFFAGNTSHN